MVISEHKLIDTFKTYLDTIHSEYYSFVKLDNELKANFMREQSCLSSCGKGGVAILVKKKLQFSVKEIPYDLSDCIIGIELLLSNTIPLFILEYIYHATMTYRNLNKVLP